MTTVSKTAPSRAHAAVRQGRGPSIARQTSRGRPTAYGVKKDIWSSRGKIVNTIAKLGEVGSVIKKAEAIRFLDEYDNEASAPFVFKKVGKVQQLVKA